MSYPYWWIHAKQEGYYSQTFSLTAPSAADAITMFNINYPEWSIEKIEVQNLISPKERSGE